MKCITIKHFCNSDKRIFEVLRHFAGLLFACLAIIYLMTLFFSICNKFFLLFYWLFDLFTQYFRKYKRNCSRKLLELITLQFKQWHLKIFFTTRLQWCGFWGHHSSDGPFDPFLWCINLFEVENLGCKLLGWIEVGWNPHKRNALFEDFKYLRSE